MSHQYIPIFQDLIRHAERKKEWIIILTPQDSECAKGFRSFGLGLLPKDSEFSGRTVKFSEGGKLSLAESTHELDTKDKDFSLVVLGFSEKNTPLKPKEELALASWRKRARQTITLGDKPGELIFH